MARVTDGEKEVFHYQIDRFVQQNGEWFYMTREGSERGPFESKDDAEGDTVLYIRHQINMQGYGH